MREVDMEFTVTVTYKVTAYGNSRSECESKAENMSIEEIQSTGTVQDVEIGDGVQF